MRIPRVGRFKLQGPEGRQYNRAMLGPNSRAAFVGAGNMTEALIAGLLHANRTLPSQLTASDIDHRRCDLLRDRYRVAATQKNREAVMGADVVVLAVEPQVLDEVLEEIAPSVRNTALVVSVAAGYPIRRVARYLAALPLSHIVRAMPNTPSRIRAGVTAWAAADSLTPEHTALVTALFESVGPTVRVKESALDAVTGLSGSGPAYVYVLIEALADGGVKMGLPRDTAQVLAAQTVAGAARLLLESGEHPGVLKDRVASPGGTTIAGLHALERGRFRATLVSAVEAATKRATELGISG
ncbi:MAG TPA: pyrroline-5-carboxylate reductase [Nitrospira sp.]|nr:pyrroline-5-carboxylate reductase [Nitrospira sp.]